MAFGKARSASDSTQTFKRYIGFAPVKVLAMNPDKKKLEELGFTQQEEPSYTSKVTIDGKEYTQLNITFIVETTKDAAIPGIKAKMVFKLRDQFMKGSQSGKYKVMDEYARTAWTDEDTIRGRGDIFYSNGKVRITNNYRPLYKNEEELTMFCKKLMVLPNVERLVDGNWIMRPESERDDCKARFDDVSNWFKGGSLDEIKNCIEMQPDNFVFVLFGIHKYVDNEGNERESQTIYTSMVASPKGRTESISKDIEEKRAAGIKVDEYEYCPIKEYNSTPAKVEPTEDDELPFGPQEASDSSKDSFWD